MDKNETSAELALLSEDIMKLRDRLNALVAKGTLTHHTIENYSCRQAKAELTRASERLATAACWNLE
jgi:hypothetical protein